MFEIKSGLETIATVSGCEAAWSVWASALEVARISGRPLTLWAVDGERSVMVAHS